MELSLRGIQSPGVLAKERVIIDVLSNTNIGGYMLSKGRREGGRNISSAIYHLIWLPDLDVEEGDLISIFTKVGTNTNLQNSRGTTTYRFYLDQTEALWRTPKSVAVLLELASWDFEREI